MKKFILFSIFCISIIFISTTKITWADSNNEKLSTTTTSYSNSAININANCFSITKQPHANSNDNLFNVKVNKGLLPMDVKNFTKIRVVTSDRPFDHPSVPYQVTETKIHGYGLQNYSDKGFNSLVKANINQYMLILLFDDNVNALGYALFQIKFDSLGYSVIGYTSVPTIENSALNINAECFSITKQPYADSNYNLFNVKVNKDLLPMNVKNFTKIRVVSSNIPFDHPLVPYEVADTKIHGYGLKNYSDNGFNSLVNSNVDQYMLILLFDDNVNALGYYFLKVS